MSLPPLTIRNLTSTPTELKVVERYESPTPLEENNGNIANATIANVTKTFTSLMSNVTSRGAPSPSPTQLASLSESHSSQDVSVPIQPFEEKGTDIQRGVNEVLRLTFKTEGQRYKLEGPTATRKTIVLTPMSPDPKHEYTAVYISRENYIALYSSAALDHWMAKIRDDAPLSALSIPGTHNSPTCHTALPSVRCQAVDVPEQLNNGVRFLDIRVQPENPDDSNNDRLILVHSAFPISLTGNKYFRDLYNQVKEFLDRNPAETVIISLKREGTGKATDQQLSRILHNHYANESDRWYTEPRIPTLGEVRKKIVLVRRFGMDDSLRGEHDGRGWGIDGSSWPDNCEDGLCGSGDIRVQDFYEVEESKNIDKKVTFAVGHLERSGACVCSLPGQGQDAAQAAQQEAAKQPLFINFLSASNFFSPSCWPDRIAAKVNPHVIEYLCKGHNSDGQGKTVGDGCTGIVVCDWVGDRGDWDLVRCVVGHNAKLEMRG
jgi:1-phosphatidylinositol phosphodiesterase